MNARVAVDTLRAKELASQVDELGALEAEILPYKGKILRVDTLRRAIREHFASAPPLAPIETLGAKYGAALGACGSQRWINPALLIKAIGAKAYAAIAVVTLAVLERNVSREIAAGVITSKATGARTLTTFEKNVPRP
jgi:hypothetical protein